MRSNISTPINAIGIINTVLNRYNIELNKTPTICILAFPYFDINFATNAADIIDATIDVDVKNPRFFMLIE